MAQEREEWQVEHLLRGRSPEELEASIKRDVEAFVAVRAELTDDIGAARLREIIELKERIIFDMEGLQDYYGMQFATNTEDQQALARMTYLEQLGTDLGNKMLFFSLWFMRLPDGPAKRLLGSEELADYRYYLELVRKAQPYTKDEETEKIISIKDMTSGSHGHLYDILTSGFHYDFDGKEGLTQEELRKYVFDQDPQKRKAAYEKLLEPYAQHQTLLTELYKNVVLDWDNEGITIRGYEDPLSVRNEANDIDGEAVRALMRVVRKNAGLFREYFRLRREINQSYGAEYEDSRYHLYAPFAGRTSKEYSYGEAKELVLDTYKRFDERFWQAAKEIFDAGHVHSHPRKHKRSGAFCSYLGGLIKPYIFLNHSGTVRDVFTMMHEFGHGIHGVLAEQQRPLLHHAALPMAETASIMGEMILADRLLTESRDGEERLSILLHLLDNEWASIVRQVSFAAFEERAHELVRAGASREDLDKEYRELLVEQFGDMEVPSCFDREWNYIPHIHHTPFYVYAYAWGNLLVLVLYDRYKKEGKPFVEELVSILSAGGSKRPQDLLLGLGMDATQESFWEGGFSIIREQVERLRQEREAL